MNKKQLADILSCDVQHIEQVDSKQLYIVSGYDLYSYSTLIGIKVQGIWYLTNEKFSATTSKQTTQFINTQRCTCIRVSKEEFKTLVSTNRLV